MSVLSTDFSIQRFGWTTPTMEAKKQEIEDEEPQSLLKRTLDALPQSTLYMSTDTLPCPLLCQFTTSSRSALSAHLAVHYNLHGAAKESSLVQGRQRLFRCRQCGFEFHSKLHLWQHVRVHIPAERAFFCPACPFVTQYRHHLEYHTRTHAGFKPFSCGQCSYKCVNKSMLNSHLKSHSNIYGYRCRDCVYMSKYCHSLKVHLRKHGHRPCGRDVDEFGEYRDSNDRNTGANMQCKDNSQQNSKINLDTLSTVHHINKNSKSVYDSPCNNNEPNKTLREESIPTAHDHTSVVSKISGNTIISNKDFSLQDKTNMTLTLSTDKHIIPTFLYNTDFSMNLERSVMSSQNICFTSVFPYKNNHNIDINSSNQCIVLEISKQSPNSIRSSDRTSSTNAVDTSNMLHFIPTISDVIVSQFNINTDENEINTCRPLDLSKTKKDICPSRRQRKGKAFKLQLRQPDN